MLETIKDIAHIPRPSWTFWRLNGSNRTKNAGGDSNQRNAECSGEEEFKVTLENLHFLRKCRCECIKLNLLAELCWKAKKKFEECEFEKEKCIIVEGRTIWQKVSVECW